MFGGQVLGEAVGVLGGMLGGGLVGVGLDAITQSPPQWLCQRFTCIGAVSGMIGGLALGAQIAGDLQDGRGKLWGTALGTAAGVGSLVGLVMITDHFDLDVSGPVAFVVTTSLVVGGPIAGYHLSADEPASSAFMLSLAAGRF